MKALLRCSRVLTQSRVRSQEENLKNLKGQIPNIQSKKAFIFWRISYEMYDTDLPELITMLICNSSQMFY